MPFDPERHHRRSIRLMGYDYALAGAYFVTLVTHERACLFGEVAEREMRLSAAGEIVRAQWDELPRHYPNVVLDAFVVMPNHIHAIIMLINDDPVGAGFKPALAPDREGEGSDPAHSFGPERAGFKPAPTPKRHGLAEIVRAFKTFSARNINVLRETPGNPVWQRNFYERIIRNEREHDALAAYVWNNPAQWAADRENPAVVGAERHAISCL